MTARIEAGRVHDPRAAMTQFLAICAWIGLAFAAATSRPAAGAPLAVNTETGMLAGAAFRVDVPAAWNRDLIVFYHGTATDPVLFSDDEALPPIFSPLLDQGYALIQSGYSATGWAVEQAYADTDRLRRHFEDRHGSPRRRFVMGMSMGGALLALTIESKPELYAGALSLCGAIEPSDRLMQRDFALRAAFDYYFPGVLGPLVPVPADFRPDAKADAKVAAALESNAIATQSLLHLYAAADAQSLASVLTGITYDIQEMQQRTRSNPFGNADLVYTGSMDDFALNDGVRRYRGDPRAQVYMSRWYTPNGKLLRPLLALHDSGDPLVPASSAFEYALIAQRAGHGDQFVQLYVNHEGHCVFTPDEVRRAFDALRGWVDTGKRPESGKLK